MYPQLSLTRMQMLIMIGSVTSEQLADAFYADDSNDDFDSMDSRELLAMIEDDAHMVSICSALVAMGVAA